MKKVFLWLLVISIIAVFSLGGCKAAAEEEAAEEEAAVVEEEAPAEEEAVVVEEEVDPASFVGEIDVWSFNDEFDKMIPLMFNAIYPNLKINHT